jgi:predicted ATPase
LLETMLVTCLADAAKRSPIMLILEDCHWLDALSMDLLQQVTEAIESLPVLVILSYRSSGDERLRNSSISSFPCFSAVELSPLTEEDLASLAGHRLRQLPDYGRDETATAALALRIARQADGNPFYLEELVNFVGSQAESAQDPNEITDLALPTSLHSLVLSRLDQLHERPKTVLKVASVVGRVFHASWLEGIYPELGAMADIRHDLEELSRRNFTVFDPGEGDDTYYFRNVITRGVIYDSLLHKSRTALHEQAGQFLETTYAGDTDQYLDLLAYHYDHGQSEDKKRYYLRRAGEFAQKSYANQAAIDYFRKVAPLLPASEQIEIKLKLGEVEQLLGNWDAAARHFQEALSLARSTGDRSAVGWSQWAAGELQRMRGSYNRALNWFDRAKVSFETVGDKKGLAQVLHYSGNVATQQGELDLATTLFEESLAIRRELDDQVGTASLLNNLAIIAEYRDNPEESRRLHEEALAIRRTLDDRRSIAFSLGNLGHILRVLGRFSEARGSLEEAITIQREIGDRWQLATLLNNLGNVVRSQANYAEARDYYGESLAIMRELGDGWAAAYLLEDLARMIHLERHSSDALVLLSAAGSLRKAIDAPLPPAEQEAVDEMQQHIQVELGESFTKDCLETGKAMSMNEAIDYARRAVSFSN